MRTTAALLFFGLLLAAPAGQARPAVGTAQAKTLTVNWREYKGLVGGRVNFHITKIVVTRTSWSVTATVSNNSPYTLSLSNPPLISGGPFKGMWSATNAGFGLVVYMPPSKSSTGGYGGRPNNHASPSLPGKLGPKAVWHGTFSGSTSVPKGNELRISFGFFTISGAPSERKADMGEQFDWVTDHQFKL